MNATLRYVLISAVRDRLVLGLVGVMLLVLGGSALLGDAALAEGRELTVVLAAGTARVALVFGLVVFIAFHVQDLYETREIEAVLSRPISREMFIVATWAGFAAVAVLLCGVLGLGVAAVLPASDSPALAWEGFGLWLFSTVLEAMLVAALALFCCLTLERAVFGTIVALTFYMVARLMRFFVGIAERQAELQTDPLLDYIREVAVVLAHVIPRFDLFGQTSWLVHGAGAEPYGALVLVWQAVVFTPLLLVATMFDLRRKRF